MKRKRGSFPDGVTRHDILDAIEIFDANGAQGFGDSKDYDLLLSDGRRYPPKAIAGIAARRVAGRILMPIDFSAGEGQKCFNVLRENGFIIVPKAEARNVSETSDDWSREEVVAAVRAYLEMQSLERAGASYSKAGFNRELRQGALKKRTGASVEFRMQNISATLADCGLEWIDGYKPAKHVGPRVKGLILEILAELKPDEFWPFIPTDDEDGIKAATAAILVSKKILSRPEGENSPRKIQRDAASYARSAAVAAFVRQEANGVCECCSNPAPFLDENGLPFLEVHHVQPLSDQGADTVENAVAVCPNCHRMLHHSGERNEARARLYANISRLRPQEIQLATS